MTSMEKRWEAIADQLAGVLRFYKHLPVLTCEHCEILAAYDALKTESLELANGRP